MSAPNTTNSSAAVRYDTCLQRAKLWRLPPGHAAPQPTAVWPPENVALLEHYREWLLSGGTSINTICTLYVPMAGHALGLALRPHAELNPETDLDPALDYVRAMQPSPEWLDMCRVALDKFRRFLRQQRGLPAHAARSFDHMRYCAGLPEWLVDLLVRYQRVREPGWRTARIYEQRHRFWLAHTHVWRWLCEHYPIAGVADIRRQHLLDYIDRCLAAGHAPTYINGHLRLFHGFLLYLQTLDYDIPRALLRLPSLKEAERLPKFLTDEQVRLLRDDAEARALAAERASTLRDALLDRAVFYLLWQGGMRRGEVEDLLLDDLDVAGRKLTVRQGKGSKDRTVYFTDTAAHALSAYLAERGQGTTEHVFLYRNRPLGKDLIHGRLKAAGDRVGVKVHPHRLRHTCATQLINAGCRVTTIQKFLGHERLNSTMVYARVYDRTVAADYYTAMAQIEQRLALAGAPPDEDAPLPSAARMQLLDRAHEFAAPELGADARLMLVARMQRLLREGTAAAPSA